MKTASVTDTNSGLSQAAADRLGVSLIPMPFTIDGQVFYEGRDLSHPMFF